MAEPVGIVDVLVSGEPPEHRLPKLGSQVVATIPPGPAVGEIFSDKIGQAGGIVEFTEGKQTGVGCDLGTMEFQLQAAVEIDPQTGFFRFTGRTVRFQPSNPPLSH